MECSSRRIEIRKDEVFTEINGLQRKKGYPSFRK